MIQRQVGPEKCRVEIVGYTNYTLNTIGAHTNQLVFHAIRGELFLTHSSNERTILTRGIANYISTTTVGNDWYEYIYIYLKMIGMNLKIYIYLI